MVGRRTTVALKLPRPSLHPAEHGALPDVSLVYSDVSLVHSDVSLVHSEMSPLEPGDRLP